MVLRKMMQRDDAVMAGLAIGRARRFPTKSEQARWCGEPGTCRAFYRGIARGRRQAANLQQLRLQGVA